MEQTDHDILLKMEQKLEDLCAQNKREHGLMMDAQSDRNKACEDVKTRCDRRFAEKINTKMVFWLLGFVMTIVSFSGVLDYNIRSGIENRLDQLDKNVIKIEATINAQEKVDKAVEKILNK